MRILAMLSLIVGALICSSAARAAEAIGWIPSWEQALAEARATNKPILLMSGAPECGGVPGVW